MTHAGPVHRSGSETTPPPPGPGAPLRGLPGRSRRSLGGVFSAAALTLAGCGADAPPADEPAAFQVVDAEPAPPAVVEGYRVRLDGDASAPGEFLIRGGAPGDGMRITTGPGGIAWRDDDSVHVGSFRAQATFVQRGAPVGYREAYGLFVGGEELGGPEQRYTYLLVRGTGEFMVRRRTGSRTETLAEWTEHPAVAGVESEGAEPRNTLAVEADPEETRFVVNGAVVHRIPSGEAAPWGIAGVRVNHRLDLEVEEWTLEREPTPEAPPS